MESTTFIAASRQASLRTEMRAVANNLANMNTTGFKSEQLMFVEHVVKSKGGERLISPKFSYSRGISSRLDTQAGALDTTGGRLDVALAEEGFFAVRTVTGEDLYTRNGQFTLSADGALVTKEGHNVLGQGGAPIQFAPDVSTIEITTDGAISTETGIIGRLQVVNFDNVQDLERLNGTLFKSEAPGQDVANPRVIQGALERSNVNPLQEISRMIEVHRSFDQVRRFVQSEDERQRDMIQQFTETV